MSRITSCVASAFLLVAAIVNGQSTTIVDRSADFGIDDSLGVLAGESDRFGNFSGFYPVDYFELEQATTLDTLLAIGSVSLPSSMPTSPGSLEGITVQIFNDAEGMPDGNAFADVFTGGNFGSDGVVYLPAVALGSGFQFVQNGGGVSTLEINFTVANNGEAITLPAGGYWISVAPRTPGWHPGDPSGRWDWQPSISQTGFPRLVMSRTTFGDVEVWEPFSALGNSFAWHLTGEPAFLIGDVNGDGNVNLLDVAPFVDLLSLGGFQEEADINQDGNVDLLDVGPFVMLLGN